MRLLKLVYNAIDAMSYLVKVLVLAALLSACSSTQGTRPSSVPDNTWTSAILNR